MRLMHDSFRGHSPYLVDAVTSTIKNHYTNDSVRGMAFFFRTSRVHTLSLLNEGTSNLDKFPKKNRTNLKETRTCLETRQRPRLSHFRKRDTIACLFASSDAARKWALS
jgi:hypothetical protein